MGWNWNNLEQVWRRRRSNSTDKRMWRDVTLTKDDDGVFHLDYQPMVHVRDADNKWVTQRGTPRPLATMTRDNVLTLLYEGRPDMSVQNRIGYLLNRAVWSDVTHHRNKESTVRIRTSRWDQQRRTYFTDSWNPVGVNGGNWIRATIPYITGTKFKMDEYTGEPIELLTPVEDVSILVKNEAVQQAKADTKIIRVLIKSMARIGAFDHWVATKAAHGWLDRKDVPQTLAGVNYKQPLGEDATAVFLYGLQAATNPAFSTWDKGVWTKRPAGEREAMLMASAIDNGMRKLRKYIYETNDGYERVVK